MKDVHIGGPAPWRKGDTPEELRYARRPRQEMDTPRTRGIFRHNRGLMITLIDVLVVTIIFIVFYVILMPLSNTVSIPPYRVDISADETDETVLVRAIVSQRKSFFSPVEGRDEPSMQPIVTVAGLGKEISDLAPTGDARRVLELSWDRSREVPESGEIPLTVQIGEDERTYTVKLR